MKMYGPPPGLSDPDYRRAESSRVSIHATPAAVLPPGGTRFVSYIAGLPPTVRPAGVHTPWPCTPGPPIGVSDAGAGSGVIAGTGAVVDVVELDDVEVGSAWDAAGDVDACDVPADCGDPAADADFAPPDAPPHEVAVRAHAHTRANKDARLERVFRSTARR